MSRFFALNRNSVSKRAASALAVSALLALAVGRIHLRVQTTLVGYEIGRLKSDESKLLEERSNLRMQLAKLTTKKHLQMVTETDDGVKPDKGTFALK